MIVAVVVDVVVVVARRRYGKLSRYWNLHCARRSSRYTVVATVVPVSVGWR